MGTGMSPGSRGGGIQPGHEPTDHELLAWIDAVHEQVDPPPPDLDERVILGLSGAWLEAELATLLDREVVGARSGEQARTLTFEARSATLLLRVQDEAAGLLRVDGWLAPPRSAVLELRWTDGRSASVDVDGSGRAVATGLQPGLVQVVVRAPGAGDAPVLLVTPAFDL